MTARAQALIKHIPDQPTMGAEIGVADGRTAEALLKAFPTLTLYMVDNYAPQFAQPQRYLDTKDYHAHLSGDQQMSYAEAAKDRTEFAADRRRLRYMPSVEAAGDVESYTLDFVFIDADHSTEAVLEDIETWLPKIRAGGLLSGHDYPQIPMVVAAVDKFIERTGYKLELGGGHTWFVRI